MTRTNGLIALVVLLVVAGSANTAANVFLLRQQRDEARQLKAASDAAAQQAFDVQEQRIETISSNCEDADRRHDNAILQTAHAVGLHPRMVHGMEVVTPRLLRELKHDPKAGPYMPVLRALAPYKDCAREVFNATGYDPTNPKTIPGGATP